MPDPSGHDRDLLEATVHAQRDILRSRRPEDVARALERAVVSLGGRVVPGDVAGDEVIHLDISLGVRDPILPWAPPDDPARDRIQRILPALLEDARRFVHLLWAREDLEDPALRDELTGALHADATARLAARGQADDTLVGFTVGGADAVEQVHGPARTEVLLRQLTGFVRSELDVDERLGRLSGPSLVVLLPHARRDRAAELIHRVETRWDRQRTMPVPLQAVTSTIGPDSDATIAMLAEQLRRDRAADDRPLDAPDLRNVT